MGARQRGGRERRDDDREGAIRGRGKGQRLGSQGMWTYLTAMFLRPCRDL